MAPKTESPATAGKVASITFTAKVTKKSIPLTDKKNGISLSIEKGKVLTLPSEYEGRLKVLEADGLIEIKTNK